MKFPAYVRATVRAYRELRDAPDADVKAVLQAVKSRPFTAGFLGGAAQRDLTCPEIPGFTGAFVGRLRQVREGMAQVRLKTAVKTGCKLRVQSAETEKGKGFRLRKLEAGGRAVRSAAAETVVTLAVPKEARNGDLLFLIELDPPQEVRMEAQPRPWQRPAHRQTTRLKAEIDRQTDWPRAPGRTTLTLETDDLAVARACPRNVRRIMLVLSDRLVNQLSRRALRSLPAPTAISVPPVTFPERTARVREALARYAAWGLESIEINNVAGWDLVPDGVPVHAGPFLYAHNHVTARSLVERGATRVVYPLEGDLATLEALSHTGAAGILEVVLFAYVPLFVSRVRVVYKGGTELRDRRDEEFSVRHRDGLTCLYGRRPFCVFSRRRALEKLGVRHFRIALAGRPFPAADVGRIVGQYVRQRDVSGGTPFNWDVGLK